MNHQLLSAAVDRTVPAWKAGLAGPQLAWRRVWPVYGLLTLGAILVGCATEAGGGASAGGTSLQSNAVTTGKPASTTGGELPNALALYSGGTITLADLRAPLFEAAGGQILAETLLDRLVQRTLAERGLTRAVDDDALERERAILLRTLSPNTTAATDGDLDQGARILDELRQRRGLGSQRFADLLRRNAGLRLLVADQVTVTDIALEQAYQLQYGQRYQARLITTPAFNEAVAVVRAARAGESFVDLAIEHSTDVSRQQGGRLEPISVADASYPLAIRTALSQMQPGQVSEPIALEQGFAVLLLERTIAPDAVQLESVRDELTRRVRLQAEAVLMQQLARDLLANAQVLVLDPTLQKSWTQQRGRVEP